jgi:hypothetical protein
MEVVGEWRTFWATVVLPDLPCKVNIPQNAELSVTNLALDQLDSVSDGSRTVLYLSVGDSRPVALAPFTVGRFESTPVDLHFAENDHLVFTTRGAPVPVHVCGHLIGALALDVDNGAPAKEILPPPEDAS